MTTLTSTKIPHATEVVVSEDTITVTLMDGRTVSVPICWYPRLSHASPDHRGIWEFVGGGHGIHWPELDEDISVENLLLGEPSGEAAKSFERWKKWYREKSTEPEAEGDGERHSAP